MSDTLTDNEVASLERIAELRGQCGMLRTENNWLKDQIRRALHTTGHTKRAFVLRQALRRIGEPTP